MKNKGFSIKEVLIVCFLLVLFAKVFFLFVKVVLKVF